MSSQEGSRHWEGIMMSRQRGGHGDPESLGPEGPGPRLTSPEKIAENFRETGNRDG